MERFDARGRLVERVELGPDGAPVPAETLWLDDAGRVARTVRGTERWSYDDDRHGNWTRRRRLIVTRRGRRAGGGTRGDAGDHVLVSAAALTRRPESRHPLPSYGSREA